MNNPECWLLFSGGNILLTGSGDCLWQDIPSHLGEIVQRHPLGHHDGCFLTAVELAVPEADAAERVDSVPVRTAIMAEALPGFLMHQAASLINWGRNNRCCSRCGGSLVESARMDDRARVCKSCDYQSYPTVSPCIIVLIYRDDQILLARGIHHPPGFHSLIAGFVEPGETLEQAVAREVMEETGLIVSDIRYQSSQPWPFPHNLMVGFTARCTGGKLQVDTRELVHADWFPTDNLPQLPPRQTIARQLVEGFLEPMRSGR